MKVLIVIGALVTLLMPTHSAPTQCAAATSNTIQPGTSLTYEGSGYLTADWTQKACTASGGSIDPNKKGNQKCCNVPNARQNDFNKSCNKQTGGQGFTGYYPTAQSC
ncbi:hypothetical protein PHMEG_0008221 [Phytophthora megakarya]|uniref:Secreted protein n=1 Tax=Phytophthora megakarya TaxID=4795 RepID=A0A225WJJ3_9STRA|nr:hypothetical protein PHMEG_0008221 [Phytophthora megakarya]